MAPRFCYIVLAHRDAELVLRLLGRIRVLSPDSALLVRHDRGPGFLDQGSLERLGATELHSQIPVTWGSWSLVLAMLEALETAQQQCPSAWSVIISGQDYPLRRLTEWEAEVSSGSFDALVNAVATDPRPRATLRWRTVQLGKLQLPRPVKVFLIRAFYRVTGGRSGLLAVWRLPRDLGWAVGLRRLRPYPRGLIHHQGSQWMTLSSQAVDRVLTAHRCSPDRAATFSTSFIPDESYVQTLLHSDASLKVEQGETTHAQFQGSDAHPLPLSLEAVDVALAAGTPFGRKIEPGVNLDVADQIDARLDAFPAP